MKRCLGRLPHDPATLAAVPRAASYIPGDWPAIGIDWSRDMPADAWSPYLNAGDRAIGDCTARDMPPVEELIG